MLGIQLGTPSQGPDLTAPGRSVQVSLNPSPLSPQAAARTTLKSPLSLSTGTSPTLQTSVSESVNWVQTQHLQYQRGCEVKHTWGPVRARPLTRHMALGETLHVICKMGIGEYLGSTMGLMR